MDAAARRRRSSVRRRNNAYIIYAAKEITIPCMLSLAVLTGGPTNGALKSIAWSIAMSTTQRNASASILRFARYSTELREGF